MKTIPKLLKTLFIIGWILIIAIGYAEIRFYKNKTSEDGWKYLGEVGGKKIYGLYGHFQETGNWDFIIRVNDEIVYMEIDENRDGKADNIIHCENGRDAYSTSYDPITGTLIDRNVEYHDEGGKSKFTVIDPIGNGNFFTKIKLTNIKNEDGYLGIPESMEIYVENKWREVKKENGSLGFYNDAGKFIYIDWSKINRRKILEAKE